MRLRKNMLRVIVSTGGRISIPAEIRRNLKIKKGTRLSVFEQEGRVVLQPLTRDYFEKTAGLLKTKGRLTRALLQERSKEK